MKRPTMAEINQLRKDAGDRVIDGQTNHQPLFLAGVSAALGWVLAAPDPWGNHTDLPVTCKPDVSTVRGDL